MYKEAWSSSITLVSREDMFKLTEKSKFEKVVTLIVLNFGILTCDCDV
jgi:hypothetical protein